MLGFGGEAVLDYGLGVVDAGYDEHFEQVFGAFLLHYLDDSPHLSDFCKMGLSHASVCNRPHWNMMGFASFPMPKKPRFIELRQFEVHIDQWPMFI